MCGRVVQVSDPIRLSIVEGLDVRDTKLSNYPRRLADYLLGAGEAVFHILGPGKIEPARMTDAARRHSSGVLTYPRSL